jgi:hypothetical protein
MSFRQPKSARDAKDRAWRQWLFRNEAKLKLVRLAPAVTMSEAHWVDFLQNGYLEWYPESHDGFTFDQLSTQQMAELLAVLDNSPDYSNEPMVGWLRHRLSRADSA